MIHKNGYCGPIRVAVPHDNALCNGLFRGAVLQMGFSHSAGTRVHGHVVGTDLDDCEEVDAAIGTVLHNNVCRRIMC